MSKVRIALRAGDYGMAEELLSTRDCKELSRKSPKQHIEALSILSDCKRASGKLGTALKLVSEALKRAENDTQPSLICDLIRKQSYILYLKGNYEKAEVQAFKALELSRNHDLGRCESDVMAVIGHLFEAKADFGKALFWFAQAHDLAQKTSHHWRETGVCHHLARLNRRCGNFGHALEVAESGLKLAKSRQYARHHRNILRAIGAIYRDVGDIVRARSICEETLALSSELGAPQDLSRDHSRLGRILFHLGQYDSAISHLRASVKFARSLKRVRRLTHDYSTLAACYAAKGNYPESFKCCQASLRAALPALKGSLDLVLRVLKQTASTLDLLQKSALSGAIRNLLEESKWTDQDQRFPGYVTPYQLDLFVDKLALLIEQVLVAQLFIYKVDDIWVDTRTGKFIKDGETMPYLEGAELRVFKYLFDALGVARDCVQINDGSGGPPGTMKDCANRLKNHIFNIRKKGFPRRLLISVKVEVPEESERNPGYILKSK